MNREHLDAKSHTNLYALLGASCEGHSRSLPGKTALKRQPLPPSLNMWAALRGSLGWDWECVPAWLLAPPVRVTSVHIGFTFGLTGWAKAHLHDRLLLEQV